MRKELLIQYEEFADSNFLLESETNLMEKAVDALKKSYAPYSEFNVGSAVLLDNKIIISGNNQENSSFPCGICAERVALFSAQSTYPDAIIQIIAITANSKNFDLNDPAGPCGLCRQVLIEYEEKQGSDIVILLFNNKNMCTKF
jgi:cytidine deaminase